MRVGVTRLRTMSDNVPPPPPGSDDQPPPPPGYGSAPPPPPPPPPGGGFPPPGGDVPPPPPPPPGGGWGAPPPPPPGPGFGAQPGAGGYSVGTAFSYAFTKFKENLLPLVLITLILLVAGGVMQGVAQVATPDPSFNAETGQFEGTGLFGIATIISLLFSALTFVVTQIVQSGVIKGALEITRGQGIDIGRAFSGIDFAQVILTALLTGVLVFIGLLLCILPGLIMIFLTSFAMYFVVDRQMPAVEAIKASINLVKDNIGVLLLFFLASLAAYIVGACLCGVGLLAAIPVVVLAQAYTFRTLTGDTVVN